MIITDTSNLKKNLSLKVSEKIQYSIIDRLNLKNRSKMNLILKMQVIQYILQLCASIRRFQMIFYSAHHFAKSTFFEDS